MMIHMKPTSDQIKGFFFISWICTPPVYRSRIFKRTKIFWLSIFFFHWNKYITLSVVYMDYLDNAVGNGEIYKLYIRNVFFACFSFAFQFLYYIGTRFGFRIVTLCIKITLCIIHTVYTGIILKLYIKHFCSLLLVCKIDS